jgi:hypothetical protein
MEMQKLYTALWIQSCILKIKLLKAEKVLRSRHSGATSPPYPTQLIQQLHIGVM